MSILGTNVAIVNQILPHKNKWAWDLYLRGCSNNWMPTEISMQKDVEQWKSNILSQDERLIIKRCLGFFACSESLVGNNLLLNVFKYCNDGEIRQYIGRQQYEETLHNLTVVYCCDSLNLDIKEIYEAYINIPIVKAKDDFLMKWTTDTNHHLDFNKKEDVQSFIRNIFIYYILCEGMLFYSAFTALISLKRRNLMPGLGEQIEYTLRDEATHVEFGTTLFKKLKTENKSVFDKQYIDNLTNLVHEALALEIGFIDGILPNGTLGLSRDNLIKYVKYIADRRMEQIDFEPLFKEPQNPFPFLSENIDLPKMKNFFESRVIDYQSGNIVDDL